MFMASPAIAFARQNQKRFLSELKDLLRIPSVSTAPEHKSDVQRAAEFVANDLRRIGMENVEIIPTKGHPLIYADWLHAPGKPTALCYAHYDVQPPDPLNEWISPPFEPAERNNNVYARGAVDDKGQLWMELKAIEALMTGHGGKLPINVKFIIEGEEEVGGESIAAYVRKQKAKLKADFALVCDTELFAADLPTLCVGLRGLVYTEIEAVGAKVDLHSGMYGGAALNAAHALIKTLDSLIAHDGVLVEPLRVGIAKPSDEELSGWALLPAGSSELSDQGARPKDARAAEDFYLRTFAEPALDVNGIQSGSPTLVKTVLPVEAIANVSIRLAPGQDPDVIAPVFERLVREAAPEGAELEIEVMSSAPAGLVPPDAKAIQLGLDAFERVLGVRPALIRSGGTLPIVPALAGKGIPTVITGFGLPDSQIHSPNERLVAEYVPLGIAAARELFLAFAAL
jgi:acetylornithine deacetylase/succinyl-diaminopimelate desuccinylase-like protein